MDPRWPPPPVRPLSLALQQTLAQEVLRARQGHIQQGGATGRLLQAVVALLNSAHAGALVIAMHHTHTISCPLLRQLHLYQAHNLLIPTYSLSTLVLPFACSLTLISFFSSSGWCLKMLASHHFSSTPLCRCWRGWKTQRSRQGHSTASWNLWQLSTLTNIASQMVSGS